MKNLVKFLITFTIILFALFMVCTNYSLAENTTTDSSTTTSSATDSSETQITTTVSSTSSPDNELFPWLIQDLKTWCNICWFSDISVSRTEQHHPCRGEPQ